MKKKPSLRNSADIASAVLGFAGGMHAPGLMRNPHLHQEIELNYLPSGSMTYIANGQLVRVPARRLCVFWAAAPHQVIALDHVPKFYWFTIPFAWMLQWKLPPAFTRSLLHGNFLIDRKESDDHGMCARWDEDLRRTEPGYLHVTQLEMEARIRRLILRTPVSSRNRERPASGRISSVQAMTEVIARDYTHRLSVADIVRPTGLHPNYGMALFRSTCGMSILDYLVQHRLFHARRLLATTDLKVIEVAMESGFGSLSRFNEAFTRECGCPPREFRRRLFPG